MLEHDAQGVTLKTNATDHDTSKNNARCVKVFSKPKHFYFYYYIIYTVKPLLSDRSREMSKVVF